MANYMKEVAELLGVEFGEEFMVFGKNGEHENPYRLSESGLECNSSCGWIPAYATLEKILWGQREIKKIPYKPLPEEKYWSLGGDRFQTIQIIWADTAQDYMRLKFGMVFRTKEEAIEARPRIYQELTGKEWRREIEYGLPDDVVLLWGANSHG